MFLKIRSIAALLLCAVVVSTLSLLPNRATPASVLMIGDPAPALDADLLYLKGEKIPAFEKGKIYVIEFWATWCPPCVKSIPHITELQAKYKDKGVTFVGLTRVDENNSLEDVKTFVADMGDKMAYTVAFDSSGKTYTAYMDAARQEGIPTAFVVGRDGKLQYIGHPMAMDRTFEQIVAGTYDPSAERKRIEEREKINERLKEVEAAFGTNEWERGYKLLGEIADKEMANNAEMLSMVSGAMTAPRSRMKNPDYALALRLAERAVKLEPKNAEYHLTLALALWRGKQLDKANATLKAAGELAAGDEEMAQVVKMIGEFINAPPAVAKADTPTTATAVAPQKKSGS